MTAESQEGDTAGVLQEVIVTAQKRAQNLQDVPISITALSGDTLAEAGASSFEDYALGVPGLSAVNRGPGQTQISIRGVSQGAIGRDQPQDRETVGVYVDDMPVAVNGFNPDLRLIDIDRIELLRGPQGTLYGAGSMTGTLKIVTSQPTFGEIHGQAAVGYSSVQHGGKGFTGSGAVNLPLSDNLATRAVAYYEDSPGYIDNPRLQLRDVNDAQVSGGRLAVKWRASDDVELNFHGYHQATESGGRAVEDELLGVGSLEQDRYGRELYSDSFDALGFSLSANLKWAELSSSTSFIKRNILLNTDAASSARRFVGGGVGPLLGGNLIDATDVEDVVQEIRLTSSGERRLEWIMGVFFDSQDKSYKQDFPIPGVDAVYNVDTLAFGVNDKDDIFEGRTTIDTKQYAVFGEVAWNLFGGLKLTGGARWFRIDSDSRVLFRGVINGPETDTKVRTTDDGINPKINVSYAFGESLNVYAQSSKGFRLGGTNIGVPTTGECGAALARLGYTSAPLSYKPDGLWNYELGAKTTLLNRRLTVNGSVFRIDWDKIPFTVNTECGFDFQDNAGKARTQGAEIEIVAQPLPSLVVSLSGSYVDAQVKSVVASAGATPGDRLPAVPRYNASFSTRYSWPLRESLTGFAFMNVLAVGDTLGRFNADPLRSTPSYETANLRFGIENERASLALALNNVLDERIPYFASVDTFSGPQVFRGRPREIALDLSYRF